MKLLVIKRYSDKYTGETVEPGTKLEIGAERAKELLEAQVVEKAKNTRKTENTAS